MDNVIHIHVYNPRNAIFKGSPKRAEIHTYMCDKANVCDAFKNNKCIKVGNLFGYRCFGKKSVEEGPTVKARKFGEFISKGMNHPKYNALKCQPNKIFKVGDGYMMPYPHINLSEHSPFEEKSGFLVSGNPYIHNLTPEALSVIYTQRPMAMMGGEIKSYQKEVVPEIVKHLHDEYPDIYKALLSKHPDAAEMIENFDYTGKTAVLSTLLPGDMEISKKKWHWDGELLTGLGSHMIFAPVDSETLTLKPKDGATVKVSNVDMVSSNTVFVD